jgi:hypothetical protein
MQATAIELSIRASLSHLGGILGEEAGDSIFPSLWHHDPPNPIRLSIHSNYYIGIPPSGPPPPFRPRKVASG